MPTSENAKQSRRVLMTLHFITSNGGATNKEIAEYLFDDINADNRPAKIRNAQRITQILVEEKLVVPFTNPEGEGFVYRVASRPAVNPQAPTRISGEETLAFYFVKAFMEKFKGSTLSRQFDRLGERIDAIAPDEFIPEAPLLNLQMPGMFDFKFKTEILTYLIKRINDQTWLKIMYRRQFTQDERETVIFPQSLSFYEGLLYLIAYNPHAKKFLTYSVQNILGYAEAENQNQKAKEFDPLKFKMERFAVMDGEVKKIKLTIKKSMVHYFDDRIWHVSQKLSKDKSGNIILEFSSPIQPDLTTWIIRWIDAVIKIEPPELKDKVVSELRASLEVLEG